MWQTVRQDFFPAVSNLCRPQQFQLRETEHIPKHTHTNSNKGRTEVSFMAHLSVSGSSAVKTWWWYHVWHLTLTLLPQCSFPAQTQPSSLPAQQHPNLSWPSSTISTSPKVFLGEAGPGCRDGHMCRPSGHVQSLAVSGCCLSRWHLMAAQNIQRARQDYRIDFFTPY